MQIIAHRGASRYAPENTRAAFDLALEMGCSALETDVRLTADGVAVLMHDATVDRVTDGRGPVDRLTWTELTRLHVRWPDGPERLQPAQGEPPGIMRLEEFLERYLLAPAEEGHAPVVVLELKAPGTPEAVHRALGARSGDFSPDRLVITSFDPALLERARRLMPAVAIGLLARAVELAALETCSRLNADQICPSACSITPHAVEAARRQGLQVRVWGVHSDLRLLRRAWEAGADGATTDAPDMALAAVRSWQQLRADGSVPGPARPYSTASAAGLEGP
ncbi:MAG: hypothetical protein IMX02_03325 [Limnochordaceae bacterium]|nr:hypothetical protein [Limnochordaceae bacterium]